MCLGGELSEVPEDGDLSGFLLNVGSSVSRGSSIWQQPAGDAHIKTEKWMEGTHLLEGRLVTNGVGACTCSSPSLHVCMGSGQ